MQIIEIDQDIFNKAMNINITHNGKYFFKDIQLKKMSIKELEKNCSNLLSYIFVQLLNKSLRTSTSVKLIDQKIILTNSNVDTIIDSNSVSFIINEENETHNQNNINDDVW